MNAARFILPTLLLVFCVDATSAQNRGQGSSSTGTGSATSTPPEYTITLIEEPHGYLAPYGLNNLGEITGQRLNYPFIYNNGVLSNLCCIVGSGRALNDAGDVVGEGDSTLGPFLYTAQNGQFTTLDLGQPYDIETLPTGINNAGQIIRVFLPENLKQVRGFFLSKRHNHAPA